LVLQWFPDAETARGFDLGLPISRGRAQLEPVWKAWTELATAMKLTIYDPQLSRALNDSVQFDVLFAEIERLALFTVSSFTSSATDATSLTPSGKLWLALGVLIVVVLVLMEGLHCVL
jgi:hypothetical protein